MFKENLLEGKRILVTGGGTGLGKEMSRYFLKFGAEVLICGRRLGVLEETAKELMDENGGIIKCYGLDIRGPQVVDETIRKGADVIWMQIGIVNEAAAKKAKEHGIEVVMDRCMLVEHEYWKSGR